ncbi:MAG: hypothetical protein ACI9PY_002449 [Ascidiaceihabitans sp.]|jgi:hypothetical protein
MLDRYQREIPREADRVYLDSFIDETAAADFLCQSVRTLQKWRVTGFGPDFFKPGRSVRYRRRELIVWAEARRRKHT